MTKVTASFRAAPRRFTRFGRSKLVAIIGVGAAAGAVATAVPSAPTAGAAAPGSPPAEIVSPLPGTPDANPATQISFLGVPASRLRQITVRGSRSGVHRGRLRFYSTHTGGSFLPTHPFVPGEHVTVTATIVGYGAPRQVGTQFDVDVPYTLPLPKHDSRVAATATNVMRFHSRHDLVPAAATVTTPATDPALGDIFLTLNAGPGQAGAAILRPDGQPVWFDPLPWGVKAFDLNLQTYHGRPVLTWWQGHVVEGHGQGVDVIESSRYTPIAIVHAGNGLYADLHDFRLTPQGTAWITAFAPQHMDLRPFGGLQHGLIDDGVVQEIDVATGLVMYSWHALSQVAIADTYTRPISDPTKVMDYFHVNSVEPLPGGQLLVSSRNTWALYLIDEASGALIWRLGGKHSSFALGPGVQFAWQHDGELLPDGTVSIFNNDATPPEAKQSSALDIALDPVTKAATLVHSFQYPAGTILSASQGDVQPLPGGDIFVGWGQAGEVSEFSPDGQLTFDMHLVSPTNSYRAFRFPWHTTPLTQPALAAAPAGADTQLYASWNGATDVASWRVLAGTTTASLAPVGTYPSTGFETSIVAPTAQPLLRVQALSASGALMRTSPVVKR